MKHFARNFINFSVALAWYRETNEVAGTCNVKTLNANVIIFYSEVTFWCLNQGTTDEKEMNIMDTALHKLYLIVIHCHLEFFWSVFPRTWTECGKIETRKTPNTDSFHAVILFTFTYPPYWKRFCYTNRLVSKHCLEWSLFFTISEICKNDWKKVSYVVTETFPLCWLILMLWPGHTVCVVTIWTETSRSKVFFKIAALKIVKFMRKHLQWDYFWVKLHSRPATLLKNRPSLQMFSREFSKTFCALFLRM